MNVRCLDLGSAAGEAKQVRIDGQETAFQVEQGIIYLDKDYCAEHLVSVIC